MSLSPDDNRDREQDLVKVYLSQMSVIPPISVEEERVLACELEESRGWYRERILRSALALNMTVRLLDKIVSGQLPVDRVLLIEANDNAKKEFYLTDAVALARYAGSAPDYRAWADGIAAKGYRELTLA